MKKIIAAGGLVLNDEKELLMIFRRGKWDLPKGKLDKGERLEECAVREVEEETGLKKVSLNGPLLVTYHTYHEGTKYILKETHWYTMSVKGNQSMTPQTEEDILELKWVAEKDLKSYIEETYPSIADVLKAGLAK